jgi:uncharacterized protein DUF5330
MFFLLRVAFWLTIVLALLPSGGARTTSSGPQVGEAVSAAGAAVSDMRHFCTRQPEACEVGSQAAVWIGQRAQAGARMLYSLFNEHSGPSATGSVSSAKTAPVATPAASAAQGTLIPGDRAPTWRGSEQSKDGKPAA